MRAIPIATFLIALFPFAAADAAAHRHVTHASSPRAQALTSESINAASPRGSSIEPALIVKAEVLLDRDGAEAGNAPPRSVTARAHDQIQDRGCFGARSQPGGARIRRTQIFSAVHFPARSH